MAHSKTLSSNLVLDTILAATPQTRKSLSQVMKNYVAQYRAYDEELLRLQGRLEALAGRSDEEHKREAEDLKVKIEQLLVQMEQFARAG